ncbi:hypothetical protein ABZ616_07835, partial [Streptomyces noursei]|uniref:hypothetical protein n=1 Tax=Streptomyces noursei TaxID=1971 RepID=UPI003401EA43
PAKPAAEQVLPPLFVIWTVISPTFWSGELSEASMIRSDVRQNGTFPPLFAAVAPEPARAEVPPDRAEVPLPEPALALSG